MPLCAGAGQERGAALRAVEPLAGEPPTGQLARSAEGSAVAEDAEPTLWDVGRYIFTGQLALGGEDDAFPYTSTCTRDGCIIEDETIAIS